MTKPTSASAPRLREGGLSLVEILVGLLIGMIGMVVIFQVLTVSEQRRRTATFGSEAQTAGAIGLYTLQREVQLAGYGFGAADPAQTGCSVAAFDATRPSGQSFNFVLAPAVITQGASGAPDSITVLSGNSSRIVAQRAFTASTATTKTMETGGRSGFAIGDLIVYVTTGTPPACALVQVTALPCSAAGCTPSGSDLEVRHEAAGRFNSPSGASFATPQGFAFNLGSVNLPNQPRLTQWSVNGDRLVMTDAFGLATQGEGEISDGIVNLQAQYGVDGNGNNVIEAAEWSDTTASWRDVRAIRVALLARSGDWDREHCNANPQWTSGAGAQTFAMRSVDGSADSFGDCSESPPSPNNWRRYRYRVYETIVPLRNMIWGTAP